MSDYILFYEKQKQQHKAFIPSTIPKLVITFDHYTPLPPPQTTVDRFLKLTMATLWCYFCFTATRANDFPKPQK